MLWWKCLNAYPPPTAELRQVQQHNRQPHAAPREQPAGGNRSRSWDMLVDGHHAAEMCRRSLIAPVSWGARTHGDVRRESRTHSLSCARTSVRPRCRRCVRSCPAHSALYHRLWPGSGASTRTRASAEQSSERALILIDMLSGDGYLCSSARSAPSGLRARLLAPTPFIQFSVPTTSGGGGFQSVVRAPPPAVGPTVFPGGCPRLFGFLFNF